MESFYLEEKKYIFNNNENNHDCVFCLFFFNLYIIFFVIFFFLSFCFLRNLHLCFVVQKKVIGLSIGPKLLFDQICGSNATIHISTINIGISEYNKLVKNCFIIPEFRQYLSFRFSSTHSLVFAVASSTLYQCMCRPFHPATQQHDINNAA